jgi:hypothetical protein
MGFCHPSLDDRPTTREVMVEYADVPPGTHRVYCAQSPEGPRLPAGEILVKPGGRVERTIKWTDGKPHLK